MVKQERGKQEQRAGRHMQIRLSEQQYRAVRLMAARLGLSMQSLMDGLITEACSRQEESAFLEAAGVADRDQQRLMRCYAYSPQEVRDTLMMIVTAWERTRERERSEPAPHDQPDKRRAGQRVADRA